MYILRTYVYKYIQFGGTCATGAGKSVEYMLQKVTCMYGCRAPIRICIIYAHLWKHCLTLNAQQKPASPDVCASEKPMYHRIQFLTRDELVTSLCKHPDGPRNASARSVQWCVRYVQRAERRKECAQERGRDVRIITSPSFQPIQAPRRGGAEASSASASLHHPT